MADTNNNSTDISVLEVTESAAGNKVESKVILNILRHLENIDENMAAWAKNGTPSQANARSFGTNSTFRNRQSDRLSSFGGIGKDSRKGFLDSFESSLIDGFIGSGFSNDVKKIFQGFAGQLDTDLRGLPGAIGKQLGQSAINAFKNTDTGKALTANLQGMRANFLSNLSNRGTAFMNNLMSGNFGQRMANGASGFGSSSTAFGSFFQGAGSGLNGLWNILRGGMSALKNAPGSITSMFQAPTQLGPTAMPGHVIGPGAGGAGGLMETATQLTGAGGQVTSMLAKMGPKGWAVIGAMVALELVTDRLMSAFKDVSEGVKKLFSAISAAANRDVATREKNLKDARTRMEADYKTMVEYPFTLLQKAAEDLYNAWDQNLTKVTATQGYTKENVQDLMSAYAERLRNEGLTSYVGGTDLFNNLAKVLDTGMSNLVAEEFAYQATVLNKAIPTQDFFQYAETYASIAANAIRDGKSESEAIQYANESLESFAYGLLYTTRELTGGFSTGLTNASSIYAEASKIALAAGSDNLNAISNTLVAVQGYIGAVAPDLADGIVNVINKLATGGNDSSTVALRSLAGINASNTEFLRALANDPQSILSDMFTNLANMFTDSSDAYMEKAEGYASLFGLDAATFQRVDFSELATAIKEMNVNNDALNENMALLLSGETTTTAEQLRYQEVNKYMLDEGLSYVLDNEAARAIQQHMWDEQIAREITQAEFSVALIGDSKEGLLKIAEGVQKILDFLNPFSWFKKLGNVIATSNDAFDMSMDIAQMLDLGKVGKGNQYDLQNLVTYNKSLNLTKSLVDMMGGKSRYNSGNYRSWYDVSNTLFGTDPMASIGDLQNMVDRYNGTPTTSAAKRPTSVYSWGSVSKAQGQIASTILTSGIDLLASTVKQVAQSASGSVTSSTAKAALDKMMDQSYITDDFVKQGKTYEDWLASSSKFGIADVEQAAESVGYAMEDIKKFFEDAEAKAGQEEQHNRNMREEDFWKAGQTFWNDYYPKEFAQPMFDRMDAFYTSWVTWIGDSTYTDPWEGWHASWAEWAGDKVNINWDKYTTLVKDLCTKYAEQSAYNSYYGTYTKDGKTYRSSTLLSDLSKINADAKKEERTSMADALGETLANTLINDTQTDPALQTNVLLGQILVYVGKIMQQTENSGGGTAMIDQLAAMSLGLTQKTP